MTCGVPELECEWKFSINEGNKKYNLTAKLFKSRSEDGEMIIIVKPLKK